MVAALASSARLEVPFAFEFMYALGQHVVTGAEKARHVMQGARLDALDAARACRDRGLAFRIGQGFSEGIDAHARHFGRPPAAHCR